MVNAGAKGILITPSDTKAIVPAIQKARAKGVLVIALDTATEPQNAVDALFATNNFNAGLLIGQWSKAAIAGKKPVIATLDLQPGITVGAQRHNGFLQGMGLAKVADPNTSDLVTAPEVVCSQDTHGDQAEGQAAMENCLSKNPDINLVYTINEPAAFGAYTAIKAAGKDKQITIVSVDGGCRGVQGVVDGKIAATSQQYPLKMATHGRRGGREVRQGRHQALRLHRHRRHPHHRQGAGGRREQGQQVRGRELLGHEVALG